MFFRDIATFAGSVLPKAFAWIGLVTLGLRYWAEATNDPKRTFLGNPRLWSRLTILCFFVACFQVWRDEHAATEAARAVGPRYAVVSRDGKVLTRKNFAEYELAVEVKEEPVPSSPSETQAFYLLRFAHVPEYFEVHTNEGATAKIEPRESGRYKVTFIGTGFGAIPVQVNFVVQAY